MKLLDLPVGEYFRHSAAFAQRYVQVPEVAAQRPRLALRAPGTRELG
ncbi:MAG: hypothetical protein ACR2P8_15800 [Myxococcota bacterium]